MSQIIVVGGGQAGAALAARLRKRGFDGGITLLCGEPDPPYQRPPLSKAYLLGEMARERLYLRPESFYAENDIRLRLGRRVSAINRTARMVHLGGEVLGYDQMVLTTGALPRRLPAAIGGDLDGVHTVRTLADVDAMRADMVAGRRVLIVGGGYIGLEAAAVAVKTGLSVTLVEMAPRILQRVAAPETSDYFRKLHRTHGVDLHEGVGLSQLTGANGRVTGAELTDGSSVAADMVIVGVGILPDTALAEAAGLEIADGIAVDALGRSSDASIWAAGDCASFPHGDGRLRLESVQNAIDQAEAVADNMLGANKPYVPKPWFWSDQYDVKLQIAGLNTGHDRVVRRPGGSAGSVSHWYYGDGRLLAVDAMNDARAYMIGKRMIESGLTPPPEAVADPAADLKALLSR